MTELFSLILHQVCTLKDLHLHHHRHLPPPHPFQPLLVLLFYHSLFCFSHDTSSLYGQTVREMLSVKWLVRAI